jgi:hypothetical protein
MSKTITAKKVAYFKSALLFKLAKRGYDPAPFLSKDSDKFVTRIF